MSTTQLPPVKRVRRRLTRHFDQARQALIYRQLSPTAQQVRDEHLTYLIPENLRALERCATIVNEQGVPGDFIEAGLALGGSGVLLASVMGDRHFHGYDVFGMIPPPSDRDPEEVHHRYKVIRDGQSAGLGGDTYYGYRDDLLEEVTATFARYGVGERVTFHKGLFEDTLNVDFPVALAHIDGDWYDSVMTCLTRVAPRLSPGGFLILDDYYTWGGCRDATDTFLAEHEEFRVVPLGLSRAAGRPASSVALVYR